MQFVLPDRAALALSNALFNFLLQGRTVEEAVMRTRRALQQATGLANPAWLAGIPVLYELLRNDAGGQPAGGRAGGAGCGDQPGARCAA